MPSSWATTHAHARRRRSSSVSATWPRASTCPPCGPCSELLDYCRPFYRRWDDALAGRLLHTLDLAADDAAAPRVAGERMKAALVATLAFHPEVLILDEPLEGLDPLTREQVVDGLLELVSAEGTTLLIASHDLDVLERLLDQVAMLHDGRLVFQTSLDDLQARYRLRRGARRRAADARATCPTAASTSAPPPTGVQFLLTQFDEVHTTAALQAAFPGAASISPPRAPRGLRRPRPRAAWRKPRTRCRMSRILHLATRTTCVTHRRLLLLAWPRGVLHPVPALLPWASSSRRRASRAALVLIVAPARPRAVCIGAHPPAATARWTIARSGALARSRAA